MKRWMISMFPILLFSETLPEMLDLSSKNDQFKALDYRINSAQEEKKGYVKSMYYPSLSINAEGAYYDKVMEMSAKRSLSLSSSISFVVYDGKKRRAYLEYYDTKYRMNKTQKEVTKEEIALDLVNLYYSLQTIDALDNVKIQEITQLKEELRRIEKFLEAGTVSEEKREALAAQLLEKEVEREELLLDKNAYLLRLYWFTKQEVTPAKGAIFSEPDFSDIRMRSDIKLKEFEAALLKTSSDIQKRENNPLVIFNHQLTYSDDHYISENAMEQPEFQNRLGLSLTWKVFDFGANTAKYEAAFLEYKAKQSELSHEKRKVELDIQNSKKALVIAKRKIASSQRRLKAEEKNFSFIKKKYHAGVVDHVTFLDALSDLSDAKAKLETSKNDYEMKKATYYYNAGITIKEKIQ